MPVGEGEVEVPGVVGHQLVDPVRGVGVDPPAIDVVTPAIVLRDHGDGLARLGNPAPRANAPTRWPVPVARSFAIGEEGAQRVGPWTKNRIRFVYG